MATSKPGRRARYPERRRPSIFWLFAPIAEPLMGVLFKYDIRGSIPATGPMILCSNHYSDIDPLANAVAVWKLGRKPRFMAKESLFRVPVLGWIMRRTGQISVDRSEGANRSDSISAAQQLIAADGLVIIYPEGTLTREPAGWPMRGKSGAVRLALEHNIPIIPMATWGAHEVMPRFAKKFRFRFRTPLTIRIGEPVDLSQWQGKHASRTVNQQATEQVMREITRLLEDIRGEQAPTELYDPVAHGQTEYGMPTESDAATPSRSRRSKRRGSARKAE